MTDWLSISSRPEESFRSICNSGGNLFLVRQRLLRSITKDGLAKLNIDWESTENKPPGVRCGGSLVCVLLTKVYPKITSKDTNRSLDYCDCNRAIEIFIAQPTWIELWSQLNCIPTPTLPYPMSRQSVIQLYDIS